MNRLRTFWKQVSTSISDVGSWLITLRVGVSLVLIAKVLNEFRFMDTLYGSNGFVPGKMAWFSQNPFLPSIRDIYRLAENSMTESVFLSLFFLVQMLFAIFLLLGVVTRFSALMCWLMQVIVFNSSHLISYGFDAVLLSLLFYALIFPAGKYFSIDNLRRQVQISDRSMIPVYQKIIQVHICLIYFANGISKIGGHTWHDGSGMWDAINQPQFQSLLTPLLQKIFLMPYVPAAITWGTITIEISYPFLIWIPRLNVIALASIILLHIFIAVVFGLWLFAAVMMVFNLAAFGHVFWERKISSN